MITLSSLVILQTPSTTVIFIVFTARRYGDDKSLNARSKTGRCQLSLLQETETEK